jgi:hypothetical protein
VTALGVQASFDVECKERPSLCDLIVVRLGHLCGSIETSGTSNNSFKSYQDGLEF